MRIRQGGLTERAIDGGVLSMLTKVANLAFGVVFMGILARMLSPVDYGQFGLLTLIATACAILPSAIGQSLIQIGGRDLDALGLTAHAYLLALALVATLALLYLGHDAALAFFGDTLPAAQYAWLYVLVPSVAAVTYLDAKLSSTHQFRAQSAAELVSNIVGTCLLTVFVALFIPDVRALLIGALVGNCIKIGMQLANLKFDLAPIRPLHFRQDLQRVGYFSAMQSANFVGRNGDNLVVAKLLGAVDLGIYGRAYNLMSKPVVAVSGFINSVYFPLMVAAREDSSTFQSGYLKALAFAAFVGFPLSVYLYISAADIVWVILGSRWTAVNEPFAMLALASYFRLAYRVTETAAVSKGELFSSTARQVLYGLVVVAGSVVGAVAGVNGVAVAVSVGLALFFLVSLMHANRVVGTHLGQWARVSAPAASATVLSTAIALAAREVFNTRLGLEGLLVSSSFWATYGLFWLIAYRTLRGDVTVGLLVGLFRRSK